eukprot:scaffold8235_cov118-Isochrysis_galbana.AAC.3
MEAEGEKRAGRLGGKATKKRRQGTGWHLCGEDTQRYHVSFAQPSTPRRRMRDKVADPHTAGG